MLDVIHGLPEGFLSLPPDELYRAFPRPTLVHLEGDAPRPLVVGALLHGNEPAGLHAVQHLLHARGGRSLPRSVVLFLGNVDAARARRRRLDGQPDYNRIWGPGGSSEHALAARVLEEIERLSPIAVIDVHNNTGRNPHYSLVPRLTPGVLQLASRFSPIVVHAPYPQTTFAAASASFAPAVTLECGTPWDASGYAAAAAYLEHCLLLDGIPDQWPDEVSLHESLAVVRIPHDVTFSFDGDADLVLRADLEDTNFKTLAAGEVIARVKPGSQARLLAQDEDGLDVTDRFFAMDGNRLVTKRSVVPAMFTLDERVIRQDCVGYLLERTTPEVMQKAGGVMGPSRA